MFFRFIIQFRFHSIPSPLDLKGPLEVNNLLDNAEHLFEGQIHGPECLLKRGNEIYASTHGGEVIKINGDHITHVAKFGKPCGNHICLNCSCLTRAASSAVPYC